MNIGFDDVTVPAAITLFSALVTVFTAIITALTKTGKNKKLKNVEKNLTKSQKKNFKKEQ